MEPLKNWFGRDFYRGLAADLAEAYHRLDRRKFVRDATAGLEDLELKQRLRRTTETCRAHLPENFREAVRILQKTAPKIKEPFTGMFMPDYVALYGQDDFEFSIEALRDLTQSFSAEFAIREFLAADFERTLAVMREWVGDESPHVRRLASEGSRPRLPWATQVPALMVPPGPTLPILEALKADPSEYVRRSVANHLNDFSKDYPEQMLDLVSGWSLEDERTRWVVKHAARSLIKKGHPRSFALFGFEKKPRIEVGPMEFSPDSLRIGESLLFSIAVRSKKKRPQQLAIDYAVDYVKKAAKRSRKVFKLKETRLEPGEELRIEKKHDFADLSTRTHFPGTHRIELMVNGKVAAEAAFELRPK